MYVFLYHPSDYFARMLRGIDFNHIVMKSCHVHAIISVSLDGFYAVEVYFPHFSVRKTVEICMKILTMEIVGGYALKAAVEKCKLASTI